MDKLFFEDTNIISKAARNQACQEFLAQQRSSLEAQGYIHAISPCVVIELLHGLTKSDGAYFHKDQHRFKVLRHRGESKMLRFPVSFALHSTLGFDSPVTRLKPSDVERWLEITCAAESWEQLISGQVDFGPYAAQTYGFNATLFSEERDEHLKAHFGRMTWFRTAGTNLNRPRKAEWIEALCKVHNILCPRSEEIAALDVALDAAYRYDCFLENEAAKTNYQFQRKPGDAIDGELLFYLANPDLKILTENGKDLQLRIGTCAQATQITVLRLP